MWELEEKIIEWRQKMQAAGFVPGEIRDELESHLRDSYEKGIKLGRNPDEAFANAVQRLGQSSELKREFVADAPFRMRVFGLLKLPLASMRIVWRQKPRILGCCLVGLLAAGAYSFLNPPPYRSDGVLFLRFLSSAQGTRPERARYLIEQAISDKDLQRLDNELTSESTLARAAARIADARLAIPNIDSSDPVAVSAFLREHLQIIRARSSTAFVLRFRHPQSSVPEAVLRHYMAAVLDSDQALQAAFPGEFASKLSALRISFLEGERASIPTQDWGSVRQTSLLFSLLGLVAGLSWAFQRDPGDTVRPGSPSATPKRPAMGSIG